MPGITAAAYPESRILKFVNAGKSYAIHRTFCIKTPDWKKLMPDDKTALRKILHYALTVSDWAQAGGWYSLYLGDMDVREGCLENASKTGES